MQALRSPASIQTLLQTLVPSQVQALRSPASESRLDLQTLRSPASICKPFVMIDDADTRLDLQTLRHLRSPASICKPMSDWTSSRKTISLELFKRLDERQQRVERHWRWWWWWWWWCSKGPSDWTSSSRTISLELFDGQNAELFEDHHAAVRVVERAMERTHMPADVGVGFDLESFNKPLQPVSRIPLQPLAFCAPWWSPLHAGSERNVLHGLRENGYVHDSYQDIISACSITRVGV